MNEQTTVLNKPLEKDQESEKKETSEFLVKVRLRGSGKMLDCRVQGVDLRVGDLCVVDGGKDPEFGVVSLTKRVTLPGLKGKLKKKIMRKANSDDLERLKRNEILEKEAFEFCHERIVDREISMKLSRVEFDFLAEKATFYFSAEGRVDFRDLVKDLAQQFKIKIEMWQVGVRDEARIAGGCGACGRNLCCSSFLKDFEPVSIKMAKIQGLALNPMKISGACGRLMCCLGYEHKTYCAMRKGVPRVGKIVNVPNEGKGKVTQVNVLLEQVHVVLEDGRHVMVKTCELPKEAIQQQQPRPQGKGKGQNQQGKQGKQSKPQPKHQGKPGKQGKQPKGQGGKPGKQTNRQGKQVKRKQVHNKSVPQREK